MKQQLADIAHRLALAVHVDAHPSCCAGTCNVFDNMVFHIDLAFQDIAGRDWFKRHSDPDRPSPYDLSDPRHPARRLLRG